jgi:isoleucyl-tRNA synthetase
VATDAGETVAVDITVSPELRREGLAREVIRLVQEARKNDGLEVTDRIWLRWSTGSTGDPEVAEALTEHAGLIADEVLAADFGPGTAPAADFGPGTAPAADFGPGTGPAAGAQAQAAREHVEEDLGLTFWLRRA